MKGGTARVLRLLNPHPGKASTAPFFNFPTQFYSGALLLIMVLLVGPADAKGVLLLKADFP